MDVILEKKNLRPISQDNLIPELLVKDIIKDTKWVPGKDYFNHIKPRATVFFPTFSRGKSGLFQKSLDSILKQNLKNIEIIIIDDASTDGTLDLIYEYMKLDSRISLLLHPTNVGLPAISCYEAFLKARADYFVFGFDDNYYYPDGFEKLYDIAKENTNAFCYGNVLLHGPKGEKILLGKNPENLSLITTNYIPNGGVILSRKIIETVGFLDPHISLIHLNDWAYWQRISNFFEIKHVDTLVADEYGPSTDDSLGAIHNIDYFASMERTRLYLYQPLSLKEYESVNIFSMERFNIKENQSAILKQAKNYLEKRFLFVNDVKTNSRIYDRNIDNKKILVLKTSITASETLCFSFLPSSCKHQIILTNHIQLQDLINTDIVIVSRAIDSFQYEINTCRLLSIPVYYFTDDNFIEIKKEGGLLGEAYEKNNFRKTLKSFKGCILTSPHLVDYFQKQLLHDNLYYYPPAYAANSIIKLKENKNLYDVRILIISGLHRQKSLIEDVFPAIEALLKKNIRIELTIGNIEESFYQKYFECYKNIQCNSLKLEYNWKQLLIKSAKYFPDVIIHPYTSSENQMCKTHNMAIVANLLNAVLIAPNVIPFSNLDFKDSAILIEKPNIPQLYLEALNKVLSSKNECEQIKLNNQFFCQKNFNGDMNIDVLNKIAEESPKFTSDIVIQRYEYLIGDLNQQLVLEKNNQKFKIIDSPKNIAFKSLSQSLLELSSLRRLLLKFQKIRFFWKRPLCLWPMLENHFSRLMSHKIFNDLNTQGAILERSTSLNVNQFIDIHLDFISTDATYIACGFLTEGIFDGEFHIELFSPDKTLIIKKQSKVSLEDFNSEYLIDIKGKIDVLGLWNLRLKVDSDYPIYLLEMNEYKFFNLKKERISYFIGTF